MENQIQHYHNKLNFETDSFDLYTAITQQENIALLDVRSAEAFEKEHISFATSFPHRTMDPATLSALDRQKMYVVYCDGIGCNGSTKGALKLAQHGFKVKELTGGLEWWKRDGYPTSGILQQKDSNEVCGC